MRQGYPCAGDQGLAGGAVAGGGGAPGGGGVPAWSSSFLMPISFPPALIALPGRLIIQLTVLPVAFAAEPAADDSPESTFSPKPR